jgi:hypothetical protein
VAESPQGTYLDRAVAVMATTLVRARAGDQGAADELAVAIEAVDATDDVVIQAVLRLAQGAVLSRLGAPDASTACDAAEFRLGELGLDAPGWRNVMRAALAADPAVV